MESEAVDATFQYLRCAAAGSKIVFTYIHRGIIDGSVRPAGTEEIMSETQRCDEPWVFGIDPAELPQYLAARGLTLVEDVGASEYRARYLGPLGRKMNIFEGERTVLADISSPVRRSVSSWSAQRARGTPPSPAGRSAR